jgi:hypothetical protein
MIMMMIIIVTFKACRKTSGTGDPAVEQDKPRSKSQILAGHQWLLLYSGGRDQEEV